MRAAERETKQVLSALLQKLRLKINTAAYWGASGVLVAPEAPTAKTVSLTSESQQDFQHFYVYIVHVKHRTWDPNQAEENFFSSSSSCSPL